MIALFKICVLLNRFGLVWGLEVLILPSYVLTVIVEDRTLIVFSPGISACAEVSDQGWHWRLSDWNPSIALLSLHPAHLPGQVLLTFNFLGLQIISSM